MMGSCCSHGHKVCKGGMLLLLGVLFLLGTTGVLPDLTFAKYWPLFLIVVGLHKLACGGMKSGEECHGECKGECKDCKKK